MKNKSRFANKGEAMLAGRPASLEEFLDMKPSPSPKSVDRKTEYAEEQKSVNTVSREIVDSGNVLEKTLERRFELKIPDELAKQINNHAFERRIAQYLRTKAFQLLREQTVNNSG